MQHRQSDNGTSQGAHVQPWKHSMTCRLSAAAGAEDRRRRYCDLPGDETQLLTGTNGLGQWDRLVQRVQLQARAEVLDG